MSAPLLHVDRLSKRFPKAHRPRDRFNGWLSALLGTPQPDDVPVLKHVSLSVKRGESMAIVGENGAGKSTLLKLIAGVLQPSAGEIHRRGSMGALLELGAGFHPDYSGRRNALLSATLMGMTQAEANEKLASIAEFSGLKDKFEEPIKHYSSGMIVRLGFAVIAHCRPDLLISDEVLAVGDAAFQRKCIAWLEDYLSRGGTLLLVSHSLYHAQKLCDRACWLHQGQVEMEGDVFSVAQAYTAFHEQKIDHGRVASMDGRVELSQLQFEEPDRLQRAQPGETLVTSCSSNAASPVRVRVSRGDGSVLASSVSLVSSGQNKLTVTLPDLLPAHYAIELTPVDAVGQRAGPSVRQTLQVVGQSRELGSVRLEHDWS